MTRSESAPYLLAFALLEQEGKRSMPISGKSQSEIIEANQIPDAAYELSLEIMLRVWQRTDEGAIKRVAGEHSLFLLEIDMEKLPAELPKIKSSWLNSGNTKKLIHELKSIAIRGWTVNHAKYEAINFKPW